MTVKSLIEACNISRQTFYYHFQDLTEVIEWLLKRENEKILARTANAETPEEAIAILISASMENKTFIQKLISSQKREQIESILLSASKSYIEALIRSNPKCSVIDYSIMDTALDFWSYGLCGILFNCAVSKNEIDIDKMSQSIYRIFTGKVFNNEN